MWKQIVDLGKKVYSVTQDTQKNIEDIKAIQTQLEALSEKVRQMAYEQQRDRENAAHERENLFLRLEVALLRSDRRPLDGPGNLTLLEDSSQPVLPLLKPRAKSAKSRKP